MALILDMDGVIVDSNPVHCQAWRVYNRRFGIQSDDIGQRMYGKRNDEIVRDFFGPRLSPREVLEHGAAKEKLYRQMMAASLEKSLVPGVREFLQRHSASPMAVATNAEPANVEFVLDGAGLRSYFQLLVDGQQVERPKPDPQIYELTSNLLRVNPAQCIVFEDSVPGLAAARAAGMRTVGVRTTHSRLPDAELEIDNFLSPELEPWLRQQMSSR
jgi:beta-phosphoglucomutase